MSNQAVTQTAEDREKDSQEKCVALAESKATGEQVRFSSVEALEEYVGEHGEDGFAVFVRRAPFERRAYEHAREAGRAADIWNYDFEEYAVFRDKEMAERLGTVEDAWLPEDGDKFYYARLDEPLR